MTKKATILLLSILLLSFSTVYSQPEEAEDKPSKAWEFGVGGLATQLNRVFITDLSKSTVGGYTFDMKLRHVIYSADLYFARELNKNLYLDLQGGLGAAEVYDLYNNSSMRLFAPLSVGLQWRLSPLFNSNYIDPYIRVGLNGMYRDFEIDYSKTEHIDDATLTWLMTNVRNKDGNDTKTLFGASASAGVNMWLNDNIGLGLQASYVHYPGFITKQKNVADAVQGSVKLLFRLGGTSKKPKPIIQDRVVEKIVEVPVERIVERVVEKDPVIIERTIHDIFNNIHFKFDKDHLTQESEELLDIAARILMKEPDKRYLITGHADVHGGDAYNIDLSQRRAAAVVRGLEERGVPTNMLKSRGVGKRIAYAKFEASNEVRKGDRKVTIEEIIVPAYWDYLSKRDY